MVFATLINTQKHKKSRIENPRVGGSIPPLATIEFKHLSQTLKLGFFVGLTPG
jgi:hypothetical protein